MMNEHRLGKQRTKFVRVSERLAVELQVFPFVTIKQSGEAAWFEDRHLQEIVQLLRDLIFARVTTEGKNDSVASRSGIITGVNLRLGYSFKRKPVHHICLVLRHQDDAALSRGGGQTEVLTGDGAYRHYGVFQEKVVVFVCPLKGASHSTMSQLMNAVGSSGQAANISSYFQRQTTVSQQSAPATSSSSTESTSKPSDAPEAPTSSGETKRRELKTVSSTSVRKRKIKNILARGRPKQSESSESPTKSIKRRKKDIRSDKENLAKDKEESESDSEPCHGSTASTPARDLSYPEEASKSLEHSCVEDTDAIEGTCQDFAAEKRVEGEVCSSPEVELLSSDSEGVEMEPKESHASNQQTTEEPATTSSLGRPAECPRKHADADAADSIYVSSSDEERPDVSEGGSSSRMGKIAGAGSDTGQGVSEQEKVTSQSETDLIGPRAKLRSRVGSCLSLSRRGAGAAKGGMASGRRGRADATPDEVPPSGTSLEANSPSTSAAAPAADDSSQSSGDYLKGDGRPRLTLRKSRRVRNQTESSCSSSGTLASGRKRGASGLSAPTPPDSAHDPAVQIDSGQSGASSDAVPVSASQATDEDEELPVLTFKPRRHQQGRRVTELLQRSTLLELQSRPAEMSPSSRAAESGSDGDADVIILEIVEGTPQGPSLSSPSSPEGFTGRLKADASVSDAVLELREIHRDVREVSLLTVAQVEGIVMALQGHLLRIFQGKVESRRHEEFKRGGPARRLLNDEMLATALTEEQQDAVMDTLVSIFCRRHYKYIPYLLKVLLPETIICIYMVIHRLPYHPTEQGLRREYLVYPDPPDSV